MRLRLAAVLALASCPALPGPAAAGPWPAGHGHYYLKLSSGRLRSTVLAAPDGTRFEIPRFTKDEVGLYAFYGLTDGLSLMASVPLYRSSHLREFRRESGLGDVQAGVQAQVLRRGRVVAAVRGVLQAPTGDETRAEGLLPTGSGVWEGQVIAGIGASAFGGKGYGYVEAGHQARGGTLRDGLLYGGQVGWNATRRLVLAVSARGLEPYDKSAREVALGSPAGLSDRVTYLVYGPTLIVRVGGGLALQLDLEDTARARNLAAGATWRLGLSYAR